MWLTKKEVDKIKEKYPNGTRVQLISMIDPWGVPPGTYGTVEEVDDMGQLQMIWDNGSGLALIPDEDRFTVVEQNVQNAIDIMVVEPMKKPRKETIYNTLEQMQKTVEGYIEMVPLEDNIALICNEDGRLANLKPNRRVGSSVIMGTFFLTAIGESEDFVSMNEEQLQKYASKFMELEEHPNEDIYEAIRCMKGM